MLQFETNFLARQNREIYIYIYARYSDVKAQRFFPPPISSSDIDVSVEALEGKLAVDRVSGLFVESLSA